MIATKTKIDASKMANQVSGTQAIALCQFDCPMPPVVEIMPSGQVEIIDGFHRIAGMIAAGETQIDCITCDDDDVLAAAANAERPDEQDEALAAIYGAAK